MALKAVIEEEFLGDGVKVVRSPDPPGPTTGNFEVTVNGRLVHSKATRGQGRCESAAETIDVVKAIERSIAAGR